MAYARRNQSEDIRANRVWTADDVADLADIPAKHGDMAFEDTNNHAYVYVDGVGWVNISQADLATVTGTLDETSGGTGQSTYTTGDILYASAANTLSKLAKGTANMVLQQGASIPFWGDILNVDVLASNSLSTGAITTSGLLTTTNGQIKFPATQNASSDANTLDDYEEGTWTPVLATTGTGFTSVTYDTQSGTYVKIGSLVVVQFAIKTDAVTVGSASGNVTITGLPFTAALFGTGTLFSFSWASNNPALAYVGSGNNFLELRISNAIGNLAVADVATGADANFAAATVAYRV